LIHLVSSGGGSNAAKPSELCRTSHNKSSASIDQPIDSDCAEFAYAAVTSSQLTVCWTQGRFEAKRHSAAEQPPAVKAER
jgi:hypothetical protein